MYKAELLIVVVIVTTLCGDPVCSLHSGSATTRADSIPQTLTLLASCTETLTGNDSLLPQIVRLLDL